MDVRNRQEYTDTRRLCLFDVPLVDASDYGIIDSDWIPFMNSYRSKITGFKVRSEDYIFCFGLIYGDTEGPCHGGSAGNEIRVEFSDDEYITEISGWKQEQVNQLKITTNLATYGPYGKWSNTPFKVKFYNKILAFIGVKKSDEKLLGVQLYFYCKRMEQLI